MCHTNITSKIYGAMKHLKILALPQRPCQCISQRPCTSSQHKTPAPQQKMNFDFADFDVASLQTSVQNYLEPVNTALHVGPMPERPGLPEGPPPAKKNKGGHPKDPLLDELLEVDKDQVANAGQLQNVSRCTHYCRFCHKASAARDGPRAKKHAAFDCPNIPNRLREKVLDDMVKRSPKRLSVEEQRKLSMSVSRVCPDMEKSKFKERVRIGGAGFQGLRSSSRSFRN
jgi:hypothetical protein